MTNIESAEKTLGVAFPGDYRLFLSNFGAAGFRGYEIHGLCEEDLASENPDSPPLWSSVVGETELIRRVAEAKIPRSYFSVSGDGGDFRFYVDANQSTPDSSVVRVLGPGKDEVVATSLMGFLDVLDMDSW